MNYASELKKFITSQYIYSGVRIALAIVIPSIVLAHFGLLKEFFLFPLGTSFVGSTDQPGPFIRRRNSLILAVFCFLLVAFVASLVKDYLVLVFLEIVVFGIFFSMIGVYGQRLATVGSLSLVVLGIFIDGHLTGHDIFRSLMIFAAGCSWFVIVFCTVSTLQPYKLAGQMIGENYLELADYLRIKAKFYQKNPDYDQLFSQVISQQVKIKDLQEATRETVFKTREIVTEATTASRLLMLMFLNSIDLHERLMTSENDYRKLQENFGDTVILNEIHTYLLQLASEITRIGIALQSGTKSKPSVNLKEQLGVVYNDYFELRNREISSDTLENFMVLRQILMRITEITDEVRGIFRIFTQDAKLAKSLSTGLDYERFMPNEEKLNFKVFRNNFSLESSHFKHAIRITLALFIGYLCSKLKFLGIGHSYWILITITAILKPAYSITKSRNRLRLFGTVLGGIIAYAILFFIHNQTILFILFLASMILCFSLLKGRYFWAVLFMTMYIFLSFNFLNPGNINVIFKDRILDTAIGGVIAFLVSYFVFPVWEHTRNLDLMKKSAQSNLDYFLGVMNIIITQNFEVEEYKIRRKEAIIHLANLSDNFQKMISDPKNQQKRFQIVHQFVNTSHLMTAYTASLSQYSKTGDAYPEIDFQSWKKKIAAELQRTILLLNQEKFTEEIRKESRLAPGDTVDELLLKRKTEIDEDEFYDRRDVGKITRLTELKNISEILELIYDVAKEQRKVTENYHED